MSDKIQDDATPKEKNLSNFGEKLKARREEMGISVQDAASRLHLSPSFITMLENEDLFQAKLPPTYLRGYLRSYARLLTMPENELMLILGKLNPSPPLATPAEPLALSTTESLSLPFPLENNSYYTRIATIVISLALLTSITTWWYLHANSASSSPTMAALEQPLPALEAGIPASNALPAAQAQAQAPTPAPLNVSPVNTVAEQAKVPEINKDLGAQKPVALAAVNPEQNLPKSHQPAARQESDDEGTDEQE